MLNKTLDIDNQKIENSIRQFTSKSQGSIDVVSCLTYIKDKNKFFFGNESDNVIKITRIKFPFEGFLPKIIFVFDKNNFQNYKIRLGLVSVILLSFLILLEVFVIIISLIRKEYEVIINSLPILLFIPLILIFIEYKISIKKLKFIIDKIQ
jgi:hypothetical protein